ncbi:hypothetical protein [uncultured Roseivirga sp.]|uniref:hypothetical protein n=1 Tax=uncultured Roseivirga sp. TaxID=543088 RepID=UPI0030D7C8F3|tara:strand:- start:11084 stop:11755 length:672 start_codon:yes stop_codon:yes gene_type:complete
MKTTQIKFTIILGLVLSSFSLTAQDGNWYEYELENIKIDFPTEEVYQLDTIVNGLRLNQLYAQINNSTFIIQKLLAESGISDKNLSSLPHNRETLIEYYEGVIDGIKKQNEAENVQNEEIKIGELIGFNSLVYNTKEAPIVESRLLLAGEDLIMLSIYNPEESLSEVNEVFLNSLDLQNLNSLEQYSGQSGAYRIGYLLGQLSIYAILGIGLFFVVKLFRRKK